MSKSYYLWNKKSESPTSLHLWCKPSSSLCWTLSCCFHTCLHPSILHKAASPILQEQIWSHHSLISNPPASLHGTWDEITTPYLECPLPPSAHFLVHITPAALVFIWFLDYIFTRDLCSGHDFLLECSIPWSSHGISCHSSVSFNATSSERSPPSPPATEALSVTPPSNSLHITHHCWWQLFTICLPHLPHEFNGTQNLFLSLLLLHLQWLESLSWGSNKWKKKKSTKGRVIKLSWQTMLLWNYLQKQKGFIHYNVSLVGYRINTVKFWEINDRV